MIDMLKTKPANVSVIANSDDIEAARSRMNS
jgi:hypothetical protein